MTKSELKELQNYLQNFDNSDSTDFLDDMGVFEGLLFWLRSIYRKQGPIKLGPEFKDL